MPKAPLLIPCGECQRSSRCPVYTDIKLSVQILPFYYFLSPRGTGCTENSVQYRRYMSSNGTRSTASSEV